MAGDAAHSGVPPLRIEVEIQSSPHNDSRSLLWCCVEFNVYGGFLLDALNFTREDDGLIIAVTRELLGRVMAGFEMALMNTAEAEACFQILRWRLWEQIVRCVRDQRAGGVATLSTGFGNRQIPLPTMRAPRLAATAQAFDEKEKLRREILELMATVRSEGLAPKPKPPEKPQDPPRFTFPKLDL